jgi:hypothetical protein
MKAMKTKAASPAKGVAAKAMKTQAAALAKGVLSEYSDPGADIVGLLF